MLARWVRRGKRTGFGIALAALVTATASAQQRSCPPSRTPVTLNFNAVAPKPIFNHRLNLAGIAAQAGSGNVRSGTARPVGLTSVNTLFTLKGGMSVEQRGQASCSYLKSVDVTLGWDQMQVFVPAEYPPGSCEYRAVIDHENQHVSIIMGALREFGPLARARVEAVIAQAKPVPGGGDASLDRILAPVRAEMNSLLAEFNAMHNSRSARIDTPSNYAAVTALCKNWDGAGR